MSLRSRVIAVVVAYNRRDLLMEALSALSAQSRPVDGVVVIDNASTDGSADMVKQLWPLADLLVSEANTGGAGGFAVGLARAIAEHDADWVWLMDDDTIPEPAALHEALRVIDRGEANGTPVAIVGSRVRWTNGQDHPMNTPRRRPFLRRGEVRAAESAGGMPVRSSSFVSMLVAAPAVRELGLPIADYFIWNDDFEFSTRILRRRRGVFVPGSVVVHKTKYLGSTDADPGERFYYEVRNKVWLFRHSTGLSPFEKVVYGASTALRWIRTLLRSSDRVVLRRTLLSGLRDGFASGPRANGDVLAAAPTAAAAVGAFDALRS